MAATKKPSSSVPKDVKALMDQGYTLRKAINIAGLKKAPAKKKEY